MSKLRLVYPNDADAATLTSSPAAVASMPVTHLQDMTRARIWRSDSVVAAQHILGDFGSYGPISAVALLRHNLTTAATYRLRLYNDPGQTGTLQYDSGTQPIGELALAWGDFVWGEGVWGGATAIDWPVPYFAHWFAAVPTLSFDLQLDDPANPDGYLQASRLVLGDYWSPSSNFQKGHALAWRETSKQVRTDGGTLRTDARDPYRRFRLDLKYLDQAERSALLDKIRRAGLRQDLFVSCFPEAGGSQERDYTALVKLVESPEMVGAYYPYHATQLTFEES